MDYLELLNVPFDETYDDVLDFASRDEQRAYFQSLKIAAFEQSDIKIVKPPFDRVVVNGNYNELQNVNYCFFQQTVGDAVRWYYAFVSRIEWAGIGTVALTLSVDVWQTRLFEFELDTCYCVRGHVQRWTKQGMLLKKYLQTPEDLEVGENRVLVSRTDIGENFSNSLQTGYLIINATEGLHTTASTEDPSNGAPSAIYSYMVPVLLNPTVSSSTGDRTYDVLVGSDSTSEWWIPFDVALKALGKDPKVVSMTLVGLAYEFSSFGVNDSGKPYASWADRSMGKVVTLNFGGGGAGLNYKAVLLQCSPNYEGLTYSEYVEDIDKDEPKLSCYPFAWREVSIAREKLAEWRLQNFQGDVSKEYPSVLRLKFLFAWDQSQKSGVYFVDYAKEIFDMGVSNSQLELSLASDAYINFMATSKASERAGLAATVTSGAFGIASSGLSLLSGARGGIGGLVSGGLLGLGSSIASTANAVKQHKAKLQDLQDTPDSLKKPGNNAAFELMAGTLKPQLAAFELPEEQKERLRAYFRAYGYQMDDIVKYDTRSRKYFNFIQTQGARITGAINSTDHTALVNIFDHGVRIWHYNPDDFHGLGNYEVDNTEVYPE